MSGIPPIRGAIIGRHTDMASRIDKGLPSLLEDKTKHFDLYK